MNAKIKDDFWVLGPNSHNYQPTQWYFSTLEEAKKFCETMAQDIDGEYDILQFIGTVRQVPVPSRPIEWVILEGK